MSKELLEQYPMTEESYLELLKSAITYQYITGSDTLNKIKAKKHIGYSYFHNDDTVLNGETDEFLINNTWIRVKLNINSLVTASYYPNHKFRRKIFEQ